MVKKAKWRNFPDPFIASLIFLCAERMKPIQKKLERSMLRELAFSTFLTPFFFENRFTQL